jgi:hypothetical protein
MITRGGEGSGNHGHEGRPGEVGGSGSGGGSASRGEKILIKALQNTKEENYTYINSKVRNNFKENFDKIDETSMANIRASLEHSYTEFGNDIQIDKISIKDLSDPGTYARMDINHQMELNSKFFKDSSAFENSLNKDGAFGYHPDKCTTIKSVVDHEVGHAFFIQKGYAMESSAKNSAYLSSKKINTSDIGKKLSLYATKNTGETLAEGFTEHMNNPNPRAISQAIMKNFIKE